MIVINQLADEIARPAPWRAQGQLISANGSIIRARIPHAAPGDLCQIATRSGNTVPAQVIAFDKDIFSLAPFDRVDGITPGAAVINTGQSPTILAGEGLLGRVIDASGNYIDGKPNCSASLARVPVFASPPSPMQRVAITKQIETGIKIIDGICPIGYGQRMGLFAGPGLGKSTLLGLIARQADVDVVVIGLIGERGREVADFVCDSLGEEGLKRSVVLASTSDEPPVRRMLAARSATAIAEYFRDQGLRVLLLLDSLTRLARAIRDVSLAAGEMPVRQGFTPSVYAELPLLLERAGSSNRGSITAIYTVLTAQEHESDPLADEIKSLLDGHWVLSKYMMLEGIRPSIDPLLSISRLSTKLLSVSAQSTARTIIEMIHAYRSGLDIEAIGGLVSKTEQAAAKLAVQLREGLHQGQNENISVARTCKLFETISMAFRSLIDSPPSLSTCQ